MQPDILCPVDDTHVAAAEFAEDAVVRDRRIDPDNALPASPDHRVLASAVSGRDQNGGLRSHDAK